ncbi:MAG: DEAD/DEAH box helicase [Lachnospiraceae bacterium]|nr:DEAD/DEAH box helicase [Lachnospiraceae bacterium]
MKKNNESTSLSVRTQPLHPLSFIFTSDSFRIDETASLLSEEDAVLQKEFLKNRYKALFRIGFEEKTTGSMSFRFLQRLSLAFLDALCALPELEIAREHAEVILTQETAQELLRSVPFVIGSEHITEEWLTEMFRRLTAVYAYEITEYDGSVSMFLAEKNGKLRVPERVFFHLVESDEGPVPFAFLATYATKTESGAIRHMPLKYALTEYKNEREKLLSLLSCLNKAAEGSDFIARLVESGEMFHPLRFTAQEAYTFLKDIPVIEEAGILCRVPNWWKRRTSSVFMRVTMGEKKPSLFGFESLVSMQPSLVIGGQALTKKEIEALLEQTEGLRFLKGRWVEVNHTLLKAMLDEMEQYSGEITLKEALQLAGGVRESDDALDVGPLITNGKWLSSLISALQKPQSMKQTAVPKTVRATLRPYQKTGYTWLKYMSELGFGACLADDMGLGKTLQVLTFLDAVYQKNKKARVLLIVPASLLGNWEKETEKFAPRLPIQILHGRPKPEMEKEIKRKPCFLSVTTYGMALRMEALQSVSWDCLILDEAQAIKNPVSKQTKAVKKMKAAYRIAMTGTPIENDLSNLWSLFDFLNKGLLGSSAEFQSFTNRLENNPAGYDKLKSMVAPFILRRLKTDKSIIADLPDKLEQIDYVQMTKKQVVLYRKQVKELEEKLNDKKLQGIERRGVVLGYLTRLKQICNHPDQLLGQKAYEPEESGKFVMLKELCETIYEKRERVLVFTQYREITDCLSAYLQKIFGVAGLVIHGGTHVKTRAKLVDAFNDPDTYIPYMVLSVKAAGVGLNLTAANHVIHFDRWWNPAVENQATDRAFRIGQEKNVFVHKLVSEGTIEEKIDALIESKKELAENVIGAGGERWITEMSDAALLDLMRLEV